MTEPRGGSGRLKFLFVVAIGLSVALIGGVGFAFLTLILHQVGWWESHHSGVHVGPAGQAGLVGLVCAGVLFVFTVVTWPEWWPRRPPN